MTRKQKKELRIIIISAVLLAAAYTVTAVVRPGRLIGLLIYLVPYLTVGYSVLRKAVIHIGSGQIFDENFLMAVATIGAIAVNEYPEAVFVMLFYKVGELFESIAVGKSRKAVSSLMDIHPDYAAVERDGNEVTVTPEEVAVGDILLVRPGEKIPVDGTVVNGKTSIDTSALTGETLPRDVSEGDSVISGCINQSSLIRIRADKPYSQSTAAKILDLVENASANKSKSENFITKFARWYTPFIVIGAFVIAFVPPIFAGNLIGWIKTALNFLVISCPCALIISVPLSFFAGIGAASSKGVLVKGSGYLERLAAVTCAIFDKTGTLTEGTFTVGEVHPVSGGGDKLLETAACAECYSSHPIAVSLQNAYGKVIDRTRIGEVDELSGLGVKAVIDGKTVYVGNAKLMDEIGADYCACDAGGTVVHAAAEEGKINYLGYVRISDKVKAEAKEGLDQLRALGIKKTVMLTGDTEASARETAGKLLTDSYAASLLPSDKVSYIEKIINENSGPVMFTGDGINDAPVLARADIGIAMGALGSDAAIEAADVVIMDDDLRKIPTAVRIARKTMHIVRENIIFSLAVKLGVLVLSLFGSCPIWAAVFADVGVMVAAVINAVRAMRL